MSTGREPPLPPLKKPAADIARTAQTGANAATDGAAAALEKANAATAEIIQVPDRWPAQTDVLRGCQDMHPGLASVLVVGGVVYLMYGFAIFKTLVTVNAAVLGAYLGAWVGAGYDATLPCAILGAFVCAALCWPTMKYSVAVMGGLFGAALGASLWRTFGLDPVFAWSGAGMGLIAFGLLSFILFNGCVMMFTSLQGSVMLIFGLLGLIYKVGDVAPAVTRQMASAPFLLPMAIFIPTVMGIIYQNSSSTPAPAGPPPKK